MAFGSLGAKLVDEVGMSADEASRVIDNLGDDTAAQLDDAARSADESDGILPDSTLGKAGVFGAGAAGAAGTYSLGSQYLEVQEEQAAAQERENQAQLTDQIFNNEDLSPEQKAAALEDLASSGFLKGQTGDDEGDGSGRGFLEDPIKLVAAIAVLALVLKYGIGEDDSMTLPNVSPSTATTGASAGGG
jgi:hypothetical protein